MLVRVTTTTADGMSIEHDGAARIVDVGGGIYLPERFEVSWPSVDGFPALFMSFAVLDGVPQCREVRITSSEGGMGVRTADLRALRVDDWIETACALIGEHEIERADGIVTTVSTDRAADRLAAVRSVQRARRGSRRPLTDDLLRRVAEVYRADAHGRPTQAVADHFGVKHRTAGDYVRSARDKGFLGAAIAGKAGEQ